MFLHLEKISLIIFRILILISILIKLDSIPVFLAIPISIILGFSTEAKYLKEN